MIGGITFVVSVLCAGLMGVAIQRGGTCTVAAVDEIVTVRRCSRLVSLIEASAWVVGGLLIAQALGVLRMSPTGFALGPVTVAGGALLGFGAYVNRACVLGAIARLGSGEWAYVVTPVGFYAGCLAVGPIVAILEPDRLRGGSPILDASPWLAVLFAGFMLVRIGAPLAFARDDGRDTTLLQRLRTACASRIWSPHAATSVIGVTFLFMLLLSGAWTYTDVLAELAHGMAASVPARIALLVALFMGALIGGATAGRFRSTPVTAAQLSRCFAGGLLMGAGSRLIPGGNDGLILVGMPLLWPYAWVAFVTMCTAIAASLVIGRRLAFTQAKTVRSMRVT